MVIEQEMLIRRVRIKANRGGLQRALRFGHEPAQKRAHGFNFLRRYVAPDMVRIRTFAFVMKGNFHAVAEVREAVEKPARRILPNVDRTSSRLELFLPGPGRKPELGLAFDGE